MALTATRRGTLRKNENDRWEIVERSGHTIELSSGSVVEVLVAGQWIRTSIEHNGREYYATTRGIRLCAEMSARLPE